MAPARQDGMKDFFKTLMRPDREEDPEMTLVAQAANILQVGEYQLMQLAYLEWHGRDMPEQLTSRLFQDFVMHGEAPPWACEYARRIIRQDEIGLIEPSDPAYHRYDQNYITHVPNGVRQFTLACMILASIFVVSLLVGQIAGVEATSVLPPYFSADEISRGP